MYYISNNKAKLEEYNTQVTTAEGYDGRHTKNWAEIVTHKDGLKFAILKHPSHEAEQELEQVTELKNWFDNDI